MPKDNRDFFKQKKIWSKVKDELLSCYLTPYFAKILSSGRPTLYVDCFAGKGKFDDGKDGSPLTAVKCLEERIGGNWGRPTIDMKFIELYHAADLQANLAGKPAGLWEVIEGKFEDSIIPLLETASNKHRQLNVFLYIDPYGVKVLNTPLFDDLSKRFSTAELLINLNSFGFIREACRVMEIAFRENENELLNGIEEYDTSVLNSIEDLNTVAGSDKWRSIISDYRQGKINCYRAEEEFSHQYKEHLRQTYEYVLDMPIRLKSGQHPKYRMVHATNHPDGCLLMADNVAKRTEMLIINVQSGGQPPLWQQTADNVIVSKFLANFYNEYGVLCDSSRLRSGSGSILQTLEKRGYIEVKRVPNTSPTGKPTTFWQEGKGKVLSLRKRS